MHDPLLGLVPLPALAGIRVGGQLLLQTRQRRTKGRGVGVRLGVGGGVGATRKQRAAKGRVRMHTKRAWLALLDTSCQEGAKGDVRCLRTTGGRGGPQPAVYEGSAAAVGALKYRRLRA